MSKYTSLLEVSNKMSPFDAGDIPPETGNIYKQVARMCIYMMRYSVSDDAKKALDIRNFSQKFREQTVQYLADAIQDVLENQNSE